MHACAERGGVRQVGLVRGVAAVLGLAQAGESADAVEPGEQRVARIQACQQHAGSCREPALLQYWREATAGKAYVLFTAHSIPSEGAEPYPTQLREMVKAIAAGQHWFGYQSKSPSPIPWLGPEVPEVLRSLPRGEINVAAIGFICDHVEVLYDLDILHRDQAEAIGLRWNRLPMPNDHPLLIDALASAAGKLL